MEKGKPAPSTVAEYIALQPPAVRKRLSHIRSIVRKEAPEAFEKLSYGMPYYALAGRLLYFAAFTKHVSLFPMASGVEAFKSKLKGYTVSKGTIQFPNDKPLPTVLIRQIVRFRTAENRSKAKK
jgi:uncharacterized protein YdhG (YjbR/CyaY superfamily)